MSAARATLLPPSMNRIVQLQPTSATDLPRVVTMLVFAIVVCGFVEAGTLEPSWLGWKQVGDIAYTSSCAARLSLMVVAVAFGSPIRSSRRRTRGER
jgi:hypothetical protein